MKHPNNPRISHKAQARILAIAALVVGYATLSQQALGSGSYDSPGASTGVNQAYNLGKSVLQGLTMRDHAYGWTVEMQVKAFQQKLRVVEVPVDVRVRIGHSKVSGTLRGVLGAGHGMLRMLWRLWLAERLSRGIGRESLDKAGKRDIGMESTRLPASPVQMREVRR